MANLYKSTQVMLKGIPSYHENKNDYKILNSSDNGNAEKTQKKLYEQNYSKGYENGYIEGSRKGYSDGHKKGCSNGFEEGYKEGYEQGCNEGCEKIKNGYKDLINEAEQIVKEAKKQKKVMFKNMEEEIINFSINLAEKILCCELNKNEGAFISIIENAVNKFKTENDSISIKVKSKTGKIIEEKFDSKTINIIKDESMNDFGCILMTENGNVDISIDTQKEQVRKGLECLMKLG